jgi:hypothetical protein
LSGTTPVRREVDCPRCGPPARRDNLRHPSTLFCEGHAGGSQSERARRTGRGIPRPHRRGDPVLTCRPHLARWLLLSLRHLERSPPESCLVEAPQTTRPAASTPHGTLVRRPLLAGPVPRSSRPLGSGSAGQTAPHPLASADSMGEALRKLYAAVPGATRDGPSPYRAECTVDHIG